MCLAAHSYWPPRPSPPSITPATPTKYCGAPRPAFGRSFIYQRKIQQASGPPRKSPMIPHRRRVARPPPFEEWAASPTPTRY